MSHSGQERANSQPSEDGRTPGESKDSTARFKLTDASSRVPVVALGASAGGLEALRQLFSHLSGDSGLAFVVVQHLDPDRQSILAQVLASTTDLTVLEVTNRMRLEPNRVHVLPAGVDLAIHRGILDLVPRRKTGRLHLPIDSFFRSLAVDAGGSAIGVVLSGTGEDGTAGLRALKAAGAITMAQVPESAQFQGMPESAIAAGVVDFIGPPEAIAGELARLSRHPYVASEAPEGADAEERHPEQESSLSRILLALRQQAGVDFSGYKQTTVLRRIERRRAVRRIHTLDEYADAVGDDAGEARALAQDMLIQVTSFFRDPAAFEALEARVFTELVQRKAIDHTIRIWVPGCATGEEAYALIIGLIEVMEELDKSLTINLFGTDLSDDAIQVARLGVYPDAALVDVAPERLARFFERVDGGYRIGRRVRDCCVFVKHDLTRDPPFARLDLVSCRNVLIYFRAEMQRRVIPMLHYCLNPNGYLFLGQSETITGFADLFAPVDKEHRIFSKVGEGQLLYPLPVSRNVEATLGSSHPTNRHQLAREAQRQADHLLLARYAPPGVIVNDRLEILQFRGRTGDYLESPPGQPQVNVLRMARGDLVVHVHDAVERAKATKATVRKEGLRVRLGSETRLVNLEVTPLAAVSDSSDSYFLLLFEQGAAGAVAVGARSQAPEPDGETTRQTPAEPERLRAELAATKDYLQSLLSEHQLTTDELAASNEELMAANEELQSTNEELQSAKEELQSTNEELSTVNEQLHHRNEELDQIADDLANILASVEIPVVIVDTELCVRRFTPAVRNIASFIPEDVGRPIEDLKLKVQVEDLADKIREVLDDLSPKEWEIAARENAWFRLHIRPYRRSDDRLDGAVLSFIDVSVLKRSIDSAEQARDYAKSIVETVSSSLVVLDAELRVVSANDAFYRMFGVPAEAARDQLPERGKEIWEAPAVRSALKRAFAQQERFTDIELTTELDLGPRFLSLSGRPILWGHGPALVLLTIHDVTALRLLERERSLLLESEKQARLEAERATHAKDLFLATLSHELRTPLSTMLMSAQLLRQVAADEPRTERPVASIERAVKAQSKLIDDLLDVSRIVSGKLTLDLGPVDFAAIVEEAVDVSRPAAQAKALELDISIDHEIGTAYGDHSRLLQVANNLLSNAVKFTPQGGRITVRLERIDGGAELTVTDTGMGIRPDVLPQLFNRFVQADASVTRTHGGLGLGLSIVRHLVEAHRGSVKAESQGEGHGATFHVSLPTGSDDSATHPVATRMTASNVEGIRVLLVEDENDTREAYAAMLGRLGATVCAAPSAAEALEALRQFQPQVILSDIAMPGEDGFSFMRKVRRLDPKQGGRVPAAALTALASDEDRQQAFESGFQLHIRKPVDAAKLASVVAELAERGASEEESREDSNA